MQALAGDCSFLTIVGIYLGKNDTFMINIYSLLRKQTK